MPASSRPVRCRHLGTEVAYLAFVLCGPRSAALNDWPGFWRSLASLLKISRRDRLYNWDLAQPLVMWSDTWQTLTRFGRRMLANWTWRSRTRLGRPRLKAEIHHDQNFTLVVQANPLTNSGSAL